MPAEGVFYFEGTFGGIHKINGVQRIVISYRYDMNVIDAAFVKK